MKIALVILHADPRRGGAERYTVDLAHALSKRGHEVSILASTFANVSDTPKTGETGNPDAIRIPANGMTRSGQYRSFLDSLDGHLANQPCDIVHAMLPVRKCDVYHPHAGMAADATRRGSILKRIQNLTNRRGVYASVECKLLEGSEDPVVIALSDYVKQSIVASYPSLRPDHLATLFNAVNLDRFQVSALHNRDATQALMIAQDFERKGLTEAIEAVARVPHVHLTVVGRERTTSWENLAKQQNVATRVHFAGPSPDVRSFYANADFFVLPTRHDPCSLVVLEALACGLPVISTRFNGACEIMHSGVHGYVLEDPKDVSALSEAMQRLTDQKVRADMREACIALRPQLSYEKHLDTLLSIYGQAKSH